MSRKLTILFTPLDAMGHFYASIGIAEQLRDRGHKVVFAVPDSWKNKLTPHGFIEEWLNPDPVKASQNETNLQVLTAIAANMAPTFQQFPEEQIRNMYYVFYTSFVEQTKKYEPMLREIVARVKPDVILADQILHSPAIMDAGIPWILVVSVSPVGISSKNMPPAMTGYETELSNKPIWNRYGQMRDFIFRNMWDDFKAWVVENGGPQLKHTQIPYLLKFSPYANVYMYPAELDYTNIRPNPPKFHQFDTFARKSSEETFEIPAELLNKPGKLIYFSMGTIGCSELSMMKRLIAIFGKSPNRFIVSKGPLAEQLKLADNMWGAASVPQLAVVPLVDLVIAHGGNNTFTETFLLGKPMLILPLFADQLDNAQRLRETGLGMRLHPYHASESELLETIELLLHDENLASRMKEISQRIQSANNLDRVADLIESVATGSCGIRK